MFFVCSWQPPQTHPLPRCHTQPSRRNLAGLTLYYHDDLSPLTEMRQSPHLVLGELSNHSLLHCLEMLVMLRKGCTLTVGKTQMLRERCGSRL